MQHRFGLICCTLGVCLALAVPARAQSMSTHEIEIGGYALFGNINFTSHDSFEAILGSSSAPLFGGGATVGLPWGGLFVDVCAWRMKQDGQRVFISQGTQFNLGIPVTVTVTPIEITGGWRFRNVWGRLTPYVGAGFSSYSYKETSEFATPGENVDERFSGYHVEGGAEYRLMRWLGVGGEVTWSNIANAIGESGVSKIFGEDNLGGTTIRARVTIGR